MIVHSRAYSSERDYAGMRELAIDIVRLAGLPTYATVGDLDWWRYADDDPAANINDAQLWLEDSGQVVAFAWPSAGQVDILVHPSRPQLHAEALAWTQARCHVMVAGGSKAPVQTWSFAGDLARNSAMRASQFHQTDAGLVFYTRPVDAPILPPPLPAGYSYATLLDDTDIAARAAVQRAAFESQFMTTGKQMAVMGAPTYRRDLDVVIRSPSGGFVAFALIWLDEVNRLGTFEPVGVAVDHQRQGFGRAVMLEGLRRLQRLGARVAVVHTGPDNMPARALFESVGFTELDRCFGWICPLPQPASEVV